MVFDASRLYSYVSLSPYIIPILPQSFPHTRRRFRTSEAFPAPPKPPPGFRHCRRFRYNRTAAHVADVPEHLHII
ncbi:hypothetical protein FIBSPDRAFT_970590 [Athelia psychrophila]|uniref:Uncharacterized protein n=1 Tax=Athelia psychrophila TaxID=1759441 RepID=A0A167SLM7_9AGAM|nr:hypothetical protein FIBSPDRAFT_970590 [Fibularhizoctonia sp. CBS 109695]